MLTNRKGGGHKGTGVKGMRSSQDGKRSQSGRGPGGLGNVRNLGRRTRRRLEESGS